MKPFYRWTRDLHLYLGLFLSPLILIFAISTIALNHNWRQPKSDALPLQQAIPVNVPETTDTLEQAKSIQQQLNISGEIDSVRRLGKDQKLMIPIMKPGELTRIEVDLKAKTASVWRERQGLVAGLIYLHKMPGPHLAKFRGNWVYMRLWAVSADTAVYGILFLTVSGLYLWWMLKAERKIGWCLLGAGLLSTVALAVALSQPWEPLIR